jgi:isopenicillin-N N-acyltransferase like protein
MEIPVISISGSPYNLGFQHGKKAKEAIKKNVIFYLDHWKYFAGVSKEQIFQDAKKYIPYIQMFDPELIEELKGLADGAGRQFEEILALNSRWELNYAYNKWANPKASVPAECTAFALTPGATTNKHTLIGQNWDYNPYDSLLIVRVKQEQKPNIIMSIEAGTIGQKGFNSAGIGIVQNYLQCETDSFQLGLPILIKERGILNSNSLPECLKILTDFEGPNSGNLVIAHRDGEAINVECAPSDEFFLYPENNVLVHTNHFLSPNLKVKDTGKNRVPDSILRNFRASRILRGKSGAIEVDTLKGVLSDHFGYPHSICRHRIESLNPNEQSETNTSIIIDLTAGEMLYTEGPPCCHDYNLITMDNY